MGAFIAGEDGAELMIVTEVIPISGATEVIGEAHGMTGVIKMDQDPVLGRSAFSISGRLGRRLFALDSFKDTERA